MNGKEYATKYAGYIATYCNKQNTIIGYGGGNCVWIAGDWSWSIENWFDKEHEEIILVVNVDRKTKVNGIDWDNIEARTLPSTKNEIKKLIKALEL